YSDPAMAIRDALLAEFDHEMGTTRRLLARTPEDDFGWQPHEKSMTLGQLAGHLANIPHWSAAIFDGTAFDVETAGNGARPDQPASAAALLEEFDRKVATARARVIAATDAEMLVPWTLKNGGEEVFTMPRLAVVKSFVVNHMIHHRGQLSVYLRLRNVPVP